MPMRVLRLLMVSAMLTLPLRAEEVHSTSTLQDITRDAQERLRQWDEEDAREQQLESKYWWIGLVELAVSLAVGRTAFTTHSLTITNNGGLTFHRQADLTPPPSPAVPPLHSLTGVDKSEQSASK